MKVSILPALIIFITALGACSMFLPQETSSKERVVFPMDHGRVLGVSEVSAKHEVVEEAKNTLPKNLDNLPKPPRKIKIDEEDIDFIGGGAVILDGNSNETLFSYNSDKKMPIASITKIVTALVFLDHNPGWDKVYELNQDDRVEGGRIYLYRGDKVTVKDLFNLSLVASANTATQALVGSTGVGYDVFIQEMNLKMKELGLPNTKFVDPIGLSNENVSTAIELAKLIKVALGHEEIANTVLNKKYEFKTLNGRYGVVYSTDAMLDMSFEGEIKALGGKTGYTDSAGYCFAGKFINDEGYELYSVVLGTPSGYSRFGETKKLIEWACNNYIW